MYKQKKGRAQNDQAAPKEGYSTPVFVLRPSKLVGLKPQIGDRCKLSRF